MKKVIFLVAFLFGNSVAHACCHTNDEQREINNAKGLANELYKNHAELHSHIPRDIFESIYLMQEEECLQFIREDDDSLLEHFELIYANLEGEDQCFARCALYAGLVSMISNSSGNGCTVEAGVFYTDEEELRFNPEETKKIEDLLAFFVTSDSGSSQSEEDGSSTSTPRVPDKQTRRVKELRDEAFVPQSYLYHIVNEIQS